MHTFNSEHAGYRIKVTRTGGTAYTILGGRCAFGGKVPSNGLTARLYYDVFNPTAVRVTFIYFLFYLFFGCPLCTTISPGFQPHFRFYEVFSPSKVSSSYTYRNLL